MSWRVLIVFLMLAAVASWQGGVQLGNWLVTRAPDTLASVADKDYKALALDANGRPITAQPPQPRMDGTLGVPRERVPVEWAIEPITANDFEIDPNAKKISGDDNDAATEESETADARRLAAEGPSRRAPSELPSERQTASSAVASNPAQRPVAPPVPPGITVTVITWQQALKKELEQCANVGYFQRPTCLQNARNKYCTPSDAWGKTAECPARPSDQTTAG